jgi:hypothetical protein
MKKFLVIFQPFDRRRLISEGKSILEASPRGWALRLSWLGRQGCFFQNRPIDHRIGPTFRTRLSFREILGRTRMGKGFIASVLRLRMWKLRSRPFLKKGQRWLTRHPGPVPTILKSPLFTPSPQAGRSSNFASFRKTIKSASCKVLLVTQPLCLVAFSSTRGLLDYEAIRLNAKRSHFLS